MKLLICTQVLDKNHPILGFFHRWVEEFAKHCEVVHVICLQEGTHTLPANVHVHSLGKEQGKNRLRELWRFYTIFGQFFFTGKIDHVFYHMGAIYNIVGAPFFLLRKTQGVKFFWWKAHGSINRAGRLAGTFVDTIVTSTESGYTYWEKKRRVVGQAIDTNLFPLVVDTVRNEKQVLYVGRIVPVKRLDILIETARQLVPMGYRFVVIGPVDQNNQSYNKELLSAFTEVGVEYIGSQPYEQLPHWYQSSGFFLNTSETGSMDKTVLEAMLCGCVPLTANAAFATLLNPFGLYFSKQKVPTYVTAITKLAEQDTTSLQAALREVVVANHSLQTFFKRIFL